MAFRWDALFDQDDPEDEEDAQAEEHSAVSSEGDREASVQAMESDGEEAQPVVPGTLRFYLQHLEDPVHPGASVTLLQHCYIRMSEKLRHKTHDNYFDRDCRIHKVAAGDGVGNLYPPSLVMMRKILGTRAAHQCERHVCPCDRHVYGYVEPEDYREHRANACPKCATPRFDLVRVPCLSFLHVYILHAWSCRACTVLQVVACRELLKLDRAFSSAGAPQQRNGVQA